VITPELAAFVESGVAIHIAAASASLEPSGARVAAVAVDADGTHITAYLPEVASARVIADLQANRQAALCFGRPTDDRACQIKGEFVEARPASAGERKEVDRQWQGFLDNVGQIGFPAKITEGWTRWPAIAVRLRVTALFSQTPGPGAGAPMQ
jgi:hypothetical protein